MSEWQPIETAPIEIDILCCGFGNGRPPIVLGNFNGQWSSFNDPDKNYYPTHWMPLPPPPK